ncbi:MAG: DNA translocase FtsK [Cryomorphaceae bacterium]|jgi:S-DNA-T family DNA segregation ATPase FtsK/SpoIIIE|nr:DNA translocase FtsK [Cryomorphaceae bacterium]
MEENEYIPKSSSKPASKTEEPTRARSKKQEEAELGRQKETKNSSNDRPSAAAKLKERFNLPKIKIIVGALLSLLSIYLFLACISYLFTWTKDQDQLLNRSFVAYIFNNELPAAANWLGKFGAWTSHLLIYRGFGLPSFGLIFLLFLGGFKILFGTALLPLARATSVTISYVLWGSICLGFFSPQMSYAGGAFGFYTNQWLQITFGGFGTLFMHVIAFFVLTTLQFSPNYRALLQRIFGTKEQGNDSDEEALNDDAASFDDIYVVNTIKADQIKADNISQTVVFDDGDEDDIFEQESELILQVDKDPIQENSFDSDFEIELGADPILDTPFKTPMSEEEDRASQLVSEHGEYDPTKDLEGYLLPPLELMKEYVSTGVSVSKEELENNKDRIVETLSHYKIDIAKIKATVGPTVTLYEIVPAPGVRISKIKNLEDDIALSLSALGIRIIAPIPGKGTIGIEVPNSNPEMVSMRSLIASDKFQNFDGELPIVMGKTITNETYVFDLTKMPHLLVAGATGQGKSVGLNAILISILYKKHPAQVKFVLVDPKKVELTLFNKIERHFLAKLPGEEDAIITDTSKVVNTLNSLCIEMDDRYELLKDASVRTIKEYNAKFIGRRLNPEKGHHYLPYIIVLIDEFADLIMTAGKEVEHPIARIAQLARAIGIHLIVATQRPSVNVITGMIKANFPARIAFRVLSKIDSRTILDASGADQLIGRGDMLISTGSEMKRLQCGFVDTPEVEEICNFIGSQRAYPEALILPEYIAEGSETSGDIDMNEIDNMFVDSARIVVINQQGSASLLQRKLKLGYNRAGRIVDQLEGMNIIGPFQGSKAREVLFSDIESLDEFLRTKGLL